ncbi:hypothetical protein LMH87_010481 [Akanthomyces muscarius]|uniref:Uncharacterized protein n=1 Tax=Akanthomyces muscarius TaxID=2231603 RepID=A0A9W8UN86_AKAMU|nr:hypothetical protein LMH87_010481 [Akanthomyces muscarius]KAJ4154017.1 hypothetical protein LMH87_010481 [Akanthomyces muscarius]
MQLPSLLVLATVSAVSAIPADYSGVVFYENPDFGGFSYTIPTTDRCWPLQERIFQKASSVRISTPGTICVVYRDLACATPPLYNRLGRTISNLDAIGLGDRIGSVSCARA